MRTSAIYCDIAVHTDAIRESDQAAATGRPAMERRIDFSRKWAILGLRLRPIPSGRSTAVDASRKAPSQQPLQVDHKDMLDMLLEEAKQVLQIEADGILNLIDRLDDRFDHMVEAIMKATGRVIVSGIGKSGIIGRKISATLNSTGTRSLFLHPVEAMHGDLGMVGADDIFLAMSYSGETDELNILMPSIRNIGCTVIAMTGNTASTLAKHSDIVIDVGVNKEACPLGLAPTASTTALLAMGDALAVVLINKKHFKTSDFKRFHPGGALGQRLARQVKDIMFTGDAVPSVVSTASMQAAVEEMDRHGLGALIIVDANHRLSGIFTDGDLRRMIAQRLPVFEQTLSDMMTTSPLHAFPQTPAFDALNIMERNEITVLPIVDHERRVQGILHLHDILGKGEFKFNGTDDQDSGQPIPMAGKESP